MVDHDVIIAKINSVQRCLNRIKDVTGLDPESLNDIDTEEIVILNLQRAIQGSIDIAAHITADEGLGIPQELRENFDLLSKHNMISSALAGKLRNMVGFRNIAVHEYDTVDIDILKSIVQHNLSDIEDFYVRVWSTSILACSRYRIVFCKYGL